MSNTTGPIEALNRAKGLLERKSADYQNSASRVRQADYYPRGVESILDIINTKRLRAISLLEAAKAGAEPNFESIADTFIDMINYCAFAAAWCEGEIEGQVYEEGPDGRVVDLFSNGRP